MHTGVFEILTIVLLYQIQTPLRTSVPNIWAAGDVCGKLQFTYIPLMTAASFSMI